ncbi:hypothetical protein JYG23_05965 [Sedimentibacter sp. zth1]|uniref:hypothetical protein n=1 Tax=Sedimentibacter sp. zth1 TaxID=2816908 RepID=UPI001A9138AF|nr:hypothetical protein [Sedimentibacter sp. zth1]QSX06937.1 hypothetical protein JYG23_05965 [Sedimentibacter sp. zth1]
MKKVIYVLTKYKRYDKLSKSLAKNISNETKNNSKKFLTNFDRDGKLIKLLRDSKALKNEP